MGRLFLFDLKLQIKYRTAMTLDQFKKKKLTTEPGVYFFLGSKREILYIGKATSLRDRVKSYFGKDIEFTRGPVVAKMVSESKNIRVIPTDSVLEALILEANLIKKHQPKANVQQKDDKSYNYVVITKEKFPRVLLSRGKDVPTDFPEKSRLYIIGPFPQGGMLKEGMRIIRKIFPFRDTCSPASTSLRLKPFNLKTRTRGEVVAGKPEQGRPCFNRQIRLCPGVCTGEISEKEYKKNIKHLIFFFEGKKSKIIRSLNGEMKALAKSREFERAQSIKRTIFALEHIQDISLIKEDPTSHKEGGFRIESYDVAHMSGKEMVGVMVVVEDGKIRKSDYRKFKIKTIPGADDTGALKEMLTRRFTHEEWPLPNLLAVDGSVAQRNTANTVLKTYKLEIPVVSVVKDERHKPRDIEGDISVIQAHRREILLGNAEAHRFAIAFHKVLRRKKFLPGMI